MSISIQQLIPAHAIHPGEFLNDELKSRGMSQKDFADLTGIQSTLLNEIIKGKRAINADLALSIGQALKMDATIWCNMQTSYELDLAKMNEKNIARIEAIHLWQMVEPFIPVKFFKKQGVIIGDPLHDNPIIKYIYRVTNFEDVARVFSQSPYIRYRRSDKLTIDKINLVGWVKLVHFKADQIHVPGFNVQNERDVIESLKAIFTNNKNTVVKTTQTLATYGIKLILQSHPEKCAVDGISFWSNGNPAVGISLRHTRIDNLAFTVMHELGHVYKHLTNDNTAEFVDMEKDEVTTEYKNSKEEKEADDFARNNLINQAAWKEFIKSYPVFDKKEVVGFAKANEIHPAIVHGRFCFETGNYKVKSSIDRTLY